VQSIDLEAEEDLFALTVFKERAIASTIFIEADWSVILANPLVPGLAAGMQNSWGWARNHNGMERLVARDSLSLSDDARLRRTQSPDLETDLDGLEKHQIYSKLEPLVQQDVQRTHQLGEIVEDLGAIGFRNFNLRGHKLTVLLGVARQGLFEGLALLEAAFATAFACSLRLTRASDLGRHLEKRSG
jgi:hypothetical protein